MARLGYTGILGGNVLGGRGFRGTTTSRSPRSQLATAAKRQFMGGARVGGGGGSGSAGSTGSGGGGSVSTGNLKQLGQKFLADYEKARTTREGRFQTGMGILSEVADMFGPGFLKGEEQLALTQMEQEMVGRGLSSTTRPAALSVGMKAQFRDRATKARAGAMTNIANFISGFQDIYPSPGTIANLALGEANLKNRSSVPSFGYGGVSTNPASQVGGPSYIASRQPSTMQNPVMASYGPTFSGSPDRTVTFGPKPTYGTGASIYQGLY